MDSVRHKYTEYKLQNPFKCAFCGSIGAKTYISSYYACQGLTTKIYFCHDSCNTAFSRISIMTIDELNRRLAEEERCLEIDANQITELILATKRRRGTIRRLRIEINETIDFNDDRSDDSEVTSVPSTDDCTMDFRSRDCLNPKKRKRQI